MLMSVTLGEYCAIHWVYTRHPLLTVQGAVSVGLLVGFSSPPLGGSILHPIMSSILRIVMAASVANLKGQILEMGSEDAGLSLLPYHSLVQVQASVLQLLRVPSLSGQRMW